MRLFLLTLFSAGTLALLVGRAGAITGNFQPDNTHTYVGLVVFYDKSGGFVERCSGSLLNARTFLTAGHCTDTASGIATATVWLSQEGGAAYDPATNKEDPFTGYPFECKNSSTFPCSTAGTLAEYGYKGLQKFGSDNADVGLVILDHPIVLDHYASLAGAGAADGLATGAPVTLSGYGLSDVKPSLTSYRERLMASAFVINTHNAVANGFNLQISSDAGDGRGGSCYGDSGGPILDGSSDVVLAVASFSKVEPAPGKLAPCAGQSFGYRTDQPAVLSWVRANAVGPVTVVPLP
jgi:Trypsin